MKITLPITVIAFETDFGGVVSNTRYLEYIERGRYALVHAAGLKITQVWDEHGVQPVVRRVEIDYLGFARHEDELELTAWVGEHSRATTRLEYELRRHNENADESSESTLLMRATQTLAYLNTKWRPARMPQLFRDALPVHRRDTEMQR